MDKPDDAASPRTEWLQIITAALLLTALNAVKPVHIDDSVYVRYAHEFAAHPLDPYAFAYGTPTIGSANHLLVPPVFPYWLALGTRVVGDSIPLLKCWLFPFALILAWAIDFLVVRFAPSIRKPVFWLTIFSPSIAPSFSFMLDVPMLALGLSAVAFAMRSTERDSWRLTLVAGIAAGLAVQTKYNGSVACGAVFMWYVFHRRPMRGVVVVAIAVAIGVGWECYVAQTQGESHFLINLTQRQGKPVRRMLHLVLPLATQMSGLATATALLGLTSFGWRKRAVAVAVCAVLGIVALACFSSQVALIAKSDGKPILTVSNLYYGLMALPIFGCLVRLEASLLQHGRAATRVQRLYDWFLPLWLTMEFGGYFVLSPGGAARRLIGLLLVFALMAGRAAYLRQVSHRAAWACTAFGAALTVLFCYTNQLDAKAGERAIIELNDRVAALGGTPGRYLSDRSGWTGATYYSERSGWSRLPWSKEFTPALRPGDLIAVSELERTAIDGMTERFDLRVEPVDSFVVGDSFPLRLALSYYSGGTPMENQRTGRVKVQLFRVLAVEQPDRKP